MLCFDKFQNGLPTIWALSETKSASDLTKVLESVRDAMEVQMKHVLSLDETWSPSTFIVDCEDGEHKALK